MNIMQRLFLVTIFYLLVACSSVQATVVFGQAKIKVADYPQTLTVEFAHTPEQRAQGLMYRESLCANCGMLFDFDEPRIVAMWMRNTLVDLDVAYITAQGEISDIIAMRALTEIPHPSSTEVRFALEMPVGWFAKHAIEMGDPIQILSAFPAPKAR
jgi:uncharacterized membrane protein (UPF0127 family)